jgi:hypothetical protein
MKISLATSVACKLFMFNIISKYSLLLCVSGVAGDLLQIHVMDIIDINTVWKYIFGPYCVLNWSFNCDEVFYIMYSCFRYLLYL